MRKLSGTANKPSTRWRTGFGFSADARGATTASVGHQLDADYFVSNAAPTATQAHGQFLFDTDAGGGTTSLSWDADGNGGGTALLLATFVNGAILTVTDFDLR